MSYTSNDNIAISHAAYVAESNRSMGFIDYNRYASFYGPYQYKFNKIEGAAKRVDTLPDRLRYWMEERNIKNKAAFTRYLNSYGYRYNERFSDTFLYSVLRGKYVPKIDKLTVMAAAMGVSVAWLSGYGDRAVNV